MGAAPTDTACVLRALITPTIGVDRSPMSVPWLVTLAASLLRSGTTGASRHGATDTCSPNPRTLPVRLLLIASVASLLLACTPRSHPRVHPPASPAARALDSTLRDAVDRAGIVGAATAVIVDGRVVWTRAYGLADRERAEPLTPRTVMALASVAKTTIGVTMMRLAQQGRLDLDADVNDYLPFRVVNPHQPTARITLRHLATHTSSITDRRDFYAALYRPPTAPRPSLDALLRSYLVAGGADHRPDNFLPVPPGASRDYSNLGAALAAYVVERVAGEPFDAHTARVIFTPLGLRSATWAPPSDASTGESRLYEQDSAGTRRVAPYALASYPDGGLRMSLEDLARYFAMLLGNGAVGGVRIVEGAAVAEMRRFQWTPVRKPADVDLADANSGLFWRTKFGGRRVGHGGNDRGVAAEMLTDAAGRVGIVVVSNTSLHGAANRQYLRMIEALTAYGQGVAANAGGAAP